MAHGASEVLDAVVVPLTLETLPPPVRHLILSQLKLPELSSLVHASPVFHAQYRESRRSLLAAALQSALHGVAVDAWAAHRSASMPLVESFAARRAAVVSYLDSYQQRRGDISKPFSLVVEAALTEEDATSMTFFYRRIVLPVMERKASLALSWLAKRSGLEPSITPLSATEEVRLLRGFYRFQLACNLFGRGRYLGKTATARGHDFRSVEILHIFLDLYEPWEVEEIACIYDFARDAVRNVFEEIAPAILSESAMADDGRPATPEGACHIESPSKQPRYPLLPLINFRLEVEESEGPKLKENTNHLPSIKTTPAPLPIPASWSVLSRAAWTCCTRPTLRLHHSRISCRL